MKVNHEDQYGRRPRSKKSTIIVAITVPVIFGVVLFGCCYICKVRRNMTGKLSYEHFYLMDHELILMLLIRNVGESF